MLVGRREERARIDLLLDRALAGRGGALAVRGEPGIGKTALLEYARERAGAARLVDTTGLETELEMPFAGLADVLRPLLGHLDELPALQREIVRGALAVGPPRPADRFAVGAASLALLAAAAGNEMLLVLVDDAHWLDAGSRDALTFAARRLTADPVVVIFAARDGERFPFDASGIEQIALSGLGRTDAAALLEGVAAAESVDTLIDLAQGNPLALLELPTTLDEAQLSGRAPLEQPLQLSAGIERAFARRALVLGEATRRALLVAAADDSGNLACVEAASRLLGVTADDLLRAEDADLVRIDESRIEFRHPLVRAAVYQGAAPSERRDAHRALADVFASVDPFRMAWHTAAAAPGADARAAEALAAVAEESRRRGAYAAAAAAFERAARLTPDTNERPRFFAEAAETAWLSGQTSKADALVTEGLSESPAAPARAELLARRGRIASYGDDQEAAFDMLVEAAHLLEDDDPSRAAELLADAVGAGLQVGGMLAADAAARLAELETNGDALRELLVAQALLSAKSIAGDVGGHDRLERALEAVEAAGALDEAPLQIFWVGRGQYMRGHNAEAARLARRAIDAGRRTEAFAVLPQALRLLAAAEFDRGQWRTAYAAAGEAVELGREVEQHSTVCACLGVLADIDAAAGNAESCAAHASAAIEIGTERRLGYYRGRAERALGRLAFAMGNTADAIEQLEALYVRLARAGNREVNVTPAWDLVEAHARVRQIERARELLAEAAEAMPPAGPGEEAVIARCVGIVGDDSAFETAFERALALHDSEPCPFERARSEHAYGERLRRAGRRKRAREVLHRAVVAFDELGASAFASRTRAELAASGARLRSTAAARENLTPRETQVALAVAEGASNEEVAAVLYVTPKTVEYHLTRVYRKLGVRSRAELVREFTQRAESG
jgi:DNA-binding CsgD family transcriptional regulator